MFVSFLMLISHVKKKIKKFVFLVLLFKSSYFPQSFVHILVSSNERGGGDETMTPPILQEACVAYQKNGFERLTHTSFVKNKLFCLFWNFTVLRLNELMSRKWFALSCSEKIIVQSKSRTSDPLIFLSSVLWENGGKMLVNITFFFSHNVFYRFLSAFVNFVLCCRDLKSSPKDKILILNWKHL